MNAHVGIGHNGSPEPLECEFPAHLSFLIDTPARYKVLWGGRGAGKTEGIALALIILCIQMKLRILCLREFHKSIADSVHPTIKHWIYDLGLENDFTITDHSIVCNRTGSEFIFAGLRYNIDNIKSMSRIDIAWVEEARNVSKYSWDKLGPTIRGRHESDPSGMGGPFGLGPEIWVSFNPELDTDETYKRFILKPPAEVAEDIRGNKVRYSIIKKVNWDDNKYLPNDSYMEMMELKRTDPIKHAEVWGGNIKQVLDGAIYAKEILKATTDNPSRIGKVKYDPSRPVNTYWDLGHSDKTAIWFIQNVGVEFNVINYYENSLQKMPHYIKYLQDLCYVYGVHNLPHDGDAETISNITPKNQLIKAGYKVRIVDRPSRKAIGINAVRTVFDLCNFDEENTADGLNCLRRYCFKVNEDTGHFSREPEHDTPWSHGADAFQTFGLSLKSETAQKKKPPISQVYEASTPNGWMN